MDPLTLNDLSANAFRILGLTADASQIQIDSAARKLRIWKDADLIPASVNDAQWIGPVPRKANDIENAVARLAEPQSRIQQRFWWFCAAPPESDAFAGNDRASIPAYHDAALIQLYRSLLSDIRGQNLRTWQIALDRFGRLAKSDDYLQWLLEVESAGDFEKAARLEEIADAQKNIPQRLCSALAAPVRDAMENGDFTSAARAIQLVGVDGPAAGATTVLLDQMEEDLACRCGDLTEKIRTAWKTRKIDKMRPVCNQAVSRYESELRPLIGQLVSCTRDIDRQNRARVLAVELLIYTSRAYEACQNFKSSLRALNAAKELAQDTPIAPTVNNLVEKTTQALARQRKSGGGKFRILGGRNSGSYGSVRWVVWVGIAASSLMRTCNWSSTPSSSNTPSGFSVPNFQPTPSNTSRNPPSYWPPPQRAPLHR
jgi:hypothetical protein